jgi:predicted Fe-Mo cluster-binding NifX family protein
MKKTVKMCVFLMIIIMGGFLLLMGQEEKPRKIAIASDGETIDSQVAYKAARCYFLLLFDEEGKLIEAVENPYLNQRGDAGINCAALLADHEVTVFVAGNVGEKMAEVLEINAITFVAFEGTVKDALKHVLEKNRT